MVLSPSLMSPNRPPPIPVPEGGAGRSSARTRSLPPKPKVGGRRKKCTPPSSGDEESKSRRSSKSRENRGSRKSGKKSSRHRQRSSESSYELSPRSSDRLLYGSNRQRPEQQGGQLFLAPTPSPPEDVPACISWSSNEDESDEQHEDKHKGGSGAERSGGGRQSPRIDDNVSLLSGDGTEVVFGGAAAGVDADGNSSQSSPFAHLDKHSPFAQWLEGGRTDTYEEGGGREYSEDDGEYSDDDDDNMDSMGGDNMSVPSLHSEYDGEDQTQGGADSGGGGDAPLTGRRLHDSARRHLERNELPQALKLFRRILEEQRDRHRAERSRHKNKSGSASAASSSSSSASVGAALHNVGLVLSRMGMYDESISALDEALLKRRAALGRTHGHVALTQIQRGTALLHLGRYEEAVTAYRDALRILRKQPRRRDDGADVDSALSGIFDRERHEADVLSRLGYLYFEAGELLASGASFEDAIDAYRSVLKGRRRTKQKENRGNNSVASGGDNNVDDNAVKRAFAETLCNLGSVQSKKKHFEDAIQSFLEALEIQRALQDDGAGPAAIATMDGLAFAYAKSKVYDRAINVYEDMLQAQLSYHGHYHDEYARTLRKMCLLEERRENYAAALECAREILALKERMHHAHSSSSGAAADAQRQQGEHSSVAKARSTVIRLEQQVRGGTR